MAKVLVSENKDLGRQLYRSDAVGNFTTFSYELSLRGAMYITTSPTGNCQVSTIAYFYNILTHSRKLEVYKDLCKCVQTNIMLIDVQQMYELDVELLFAEAGATVITKTPYVSTNTSKMVMYLVNIAKLR